MLVRGVATIAALVGLVLLGRWRSNAFLSAPDPIADPRIVPSPGREGLVRLCDVVEPYQRRWPRSGGAGSPSAVPDRDTAGESLSDDELLRQVAEILDHEVVRFPAEGDDPAADGELTYRALQLLLFWHQLARTKGLERIRAGETVSGLAELGRLRRAVSELGANGVGSATYHILFALEGKCDLTLQAALGGPPAGVDQATTDPTASWPTDGWPAETKEAWHETLAALLAWHDEPAAVRRTLAIGYYQHRHWVRGMKAVPPVCVPSDTLRLSRELCQAQLAQAGLPANQRDFSGSPKFGKLPLYYNPAGRSLLNEGAVVGPDFELQFADQRMRSTRVTSAMIALKLYLEDHGRLPADWAELVAAGYLPATPVDPLTGEALRYEPREGRTTGHVPGPVRAYRMPLPFVSAAPTSLERKPSAPRSDPQRD